MKDWASPTHCWRYQLCCWLGSTAAEHHSAVPYHDLTTVQHCHNHAAPATRHWHIKSIQINTCNSFVFFGLSDQHCWTYSTLDWTSDCPLQVYLKQDYFQVTRRTVYLRHSRGGLVILAPQPIRSQYLATFKRLGHASLRRRDWSPAVAISRQPAQAWKRRRTPP